MKIYRLLLLTVLAFASINAHAKDDKKCQEVRLSLDIGSGSTKMMVAKVDLCEKKILEVLLNESRPVAYNEDLDKSADNNLSQAIADKGLATLKEMVEKAKTFKPKRSYGVATSVFRKAKNGTDVIKTFSRNLDVRLEVISQETEAMLGYLSVLALVDPKKVDMNNVVLWDIGGGSMQIFTMDEKKRPIRYLGDLASVTFKNMVIEVLQSKSLDKESSPNPIGDKREQVLALARSYARLHVSAELKSRLKMHQKIIGVGGVHSQSIKNQLDLEAKDGKELSYTLEELDKAARTQSQKSDKDLVGDYRSTDVTNLLLVQGYMEALGIKEVQVVNATLLQGALFK